MGTGEPPRLHTHNRTPINPLPHTSTRTRTHPRTHMHIPAQTCARTHTTTRIFFHCRPLHLCCPFVENTRLQPGRVPSLDIIGEMSSSFNFGQTLRIARDTAMALGHYDDAAVYSAAYTKIQAVFHAVYWNTTTETFGNGQQAALVYALYLGAVPEASVASVFAKLLALINTTDQPPDHTSPATQQCTKPPCIDTGCVHKVYS